MFGEPREPDNKVGNLVLQVTRKYRFGATKKWAQRANLAVDTSKDSCADHLRSALGGQPRAPQRRGTSWAQHEVGSTSTGMKSLETKVP